MGPKVLVLVLKFRVLVLVLGPRVLVLVLTKKSYLHHWVKVGRH